mgnify:CR=1 FL=1
MASAGESPEASHARRGGARGFVGGETPGRPAPPRFPPKLKNGSDLPRVGGPSQMDLYDYKPGMKEWYDKDLPESVRAGQRLPPMPSWQKPFPIASPQYNFAPAGR